MAAVQRLVSSTLTIATFALLLNITLFMGTLFEVSITFPV